MTGKEITTSLKNKIQNKIIEKGFEQLKIHADLVISGGEFLYTTQNEIYFKEGVWKRSSFPHDYVEYQQLVEYLNGEKINELYIVGTQNEVSVYSNIALSDCDIKEVPFYKDPKTFIYNRLNPHLKEGVDYINNCYVNPDGSVDLSLFYAYPNGVKDSEVITEISFFEEKEISYKMAMNALGKTLEKGIKTKIIARKDQALEIKLCSGKELIDDIHCYYDYIDGGYDEIKLEVIFEPHERRTLQSDFEGYYIQNDKKLELKHYPGMDLNCLCLMTNMELKKLSIHITKEGIKATGNKAFPELGIGLNKDTLSVANDDLESICQFIESGREDKLALALKAIAQNDKTRERLEKRYLNYVKAYLEKEDASLQDITIELFSREIKNIFHGHRPLIAKNYISFEYSAEDEAKQLIDFIGGMVKNYVDINDYIKEHNEAYQQNWDYDDKVAMYERWRKQLHNGINEEIKLNPDGWYSKAYTILMKLELEKVMMDNCTYYHSKHKSAKRMPVLKEYMFYLNATANKKILYMDVYDTHMHDLTEMIWMFRQIPDICWFQSSTTYPPCPYTPIRDAKMKIDNGDWKDVEV